MQRNDVFKLVCNGQIDGQHSFANLGKHKSKLQWLYLNSVFSEVIDSIPWNTGRVSMGVVLYDCVV